MLITSCLCPLHLKVSCFSGCINPCHTIAFRKYLKCVFKEPTDNKVPFTCKPLAGFAQKFKGRFFPLFYKIQSSNQNMFQCWLWYIDVLRHAMCSQIYFLNNFRKVYLFSFLDSVFFFRDFQYLYFESSLPNLDMLPIP